MSISGTNGKSTVTRLITHILRASPGQHVGTTTSDGVLVDERMVEPGDWTGPGGAHQILARRDIDVAVLETARGGIVLRGVGYESNDASVLTNVSSDHLDLQGIHTLPELAEVKSTICRITKPDGWVVLNADDPLVAAVARRVRAHVALFTLRRRRVAGRRGAIAQRGGRAYLVRDGCHRRGERRERDADRRGRPGPDHDRRAGPPQRRQRARRGRRGARAGRHDRAGPRRPGRLRPERRALAGPAQPVPPRRAGGHRRLRPQRGRASAPSSTWPRGSPAGAAGRAAPITAIIGTAGDRPDDTLRGHRPDRRRARPARRDQGDAQVPARPDRANRSSAS